MLRQIGRCALCFFMTAEVLKGDVAFWRSADVDSWQNASCWSTGRYPSQDGDEAVFEGLHPVETGTIVSERAITLGRLSLQTMPTVQLTFDFNREGISFSNGDRPSTLSLIGEQHHTISADIAVSSPRGLDIFVDEGAALTFFDSSVSGGPLSKIGQGDMVLRGFNPFITLGAIEEGRVLVGLANVDYTGIEGSLTIGSLGVLHGFGVLGVQGLDNQGTIEPGGFGDREVGRLSLVSHDGFCQGSKGTLCIKAIDVEKSSQLEVVAGAVSLDGTLAIEAADARFNAGDIIVVIDNLGGAGITGTFANVRAHLPKGLDAKVLYSSHEVRVEFCHARGFYVEPPVDIKGAVVVHQFLNKKQYFFEASWKKSPTDGVVGYRLYHNGKLVMSLPSSARHLMLRMTRPLVTGFSLVAINDRGVESASWNF